MYFVRYALLDVYRLDFSPAAVDPFLWTMKYEMQGSFLVFAIILSFRYLKLPWLIILISALILLLNSETSRIACFVFGIMFAAARINGVFVEIKKHRISMILSSVFLLVLACIDGFFHLKGGGHGDHGSHRHITAFAVPIVFLIYCNSPLCQFLSSRVSRKLGDLSFPLYLVQFPVLISFTSMAIIIATVHGRLNVVSIFAIGLSSVGVCLLCSFLFLPVEKFTRYVGTQLTRLTVSDESVAA
jgi:peptidoglycan/LPS O-acetylase OafA/YrhL